MKFYAQSPLKLLLFSLFLILQFSCSKDSDLLSDYVISDTQVFLSGKYAVADEYQLNSSSSLVLNVLDNDNFINGAEVVITGTSSPNNGTVVINSNQTLTYTPKTDTSTDEVEDTFTYTAEGENEDGTITEEEASVVITAAEESNRQNAVANISPWEYCQDGNPIGGGGGYDGILSAEDADIHITTNMGASAFKAIVETAKFGDIIFIDSGITINLTGLGSSSILVKQGVTIASDRGINAGALIMSDDMAYLGNGNAQPVFKTTGTNVRFTGFRFQGPYGGKGVHTTTDNTLIRLKHGIASNYNNTEIDNCELYNWPFSAVIIGEYAGAPTYFGPAQWTNDHLFHHNYVHNNRQNRYGYGINIQHADAKVYANLFQDNRHDIASGGQISPAYSGYEAYCNTVLGGNISHNFDVHGNNGNVPGTIAGKYAYIHHNDFKDLGADRGSTNRENIRISGNPEENVRIIYNRFAHPNLYQAYKIKYLIAPANEIIHNNTFNSD